ncbi:MAG: hypothetical protein AAB433_01470 [Nitrospirota bacterium]
MGDVLRLYIPGWPLCRAALSLSAYVGFIAVLGIMICVTPAQALVSTTGHARIASQSAMNALNVAKRSLAVQSIGSAIASSGSGASVAARIVASGVGWPAIGIAAGLVVAQYFWNQQQVADIKSQAGDPGPVSAGANPMPAGTIIEPCPQASGCPANMDQKLTAPSPQPPPSPGCSSQIFASSPLPAGWAGWFSQSGSPNTCVAYHVTGQPNPASQAPASPPTPQDVSDYLGGLPASDPNSMESNFDQVGAGVAPSSANQVVEFPINSTELQTQVVPASSVSPTDTVLDPSAEPGAGPVSTTETQTSTTTTTTTTNPDGSTTTQEETTTVSDCSAGQHDSRTLGTILQSHIETWRGSGIAGALSTLQLLTWPSASPTYTLNSGLLGTFSFDFTAWNGILFGLRSLIIAGAGFAAYRIIFVGGSAGAD